MKIMYMIVLMESESVWYSISDLDKSDKSESWPSACPNKPPKKFQISSNKFGAPNFAQTSREQQYGTIDLFIY